LSECGLIVGIKQPKVMRSYVLWFWRVTMLGSLIDLFGFGAAGYDSSW
jgi:hypothetical protein